MKKIFISFAILAGVTLSGCNDSFLDKLPVTDPTEETVFKSYDNFLAFMWPCYEMFSNTDIATSVNGIGQNSHYQGDINAGFMDSK